jgi:hypothetical protein
VAAPGDSRGQAEKDALQAYICARNCLLYESDPGPERLNVGTELHPLYIPRSEAWQESYAMHVVRDCDGDHGRLLAARQECDDHGTNDRAWSRAVDLCDQAIRMVEGANAVNDDRARKILLAVCQYENYLTSFGSFTDPALLAREMTDRLREVGATMADVPSTEQLISWAFPWL